MISDDPGIRMSLVFILESAGYSTRVYRTLATAPPLDGAQRYSCVVIDEFDPGEPADLAALAPLPVIVLVDRPEAPEDAGHVHYLPKPFLGPVLTEMLERLLAPIAPDTKYPK